MLPVLPMRLLSYFLTGPGVHVLHHTREDKVTDKVKSRSLIASYYTLDLLCTNIIAFFLSQ